MEIENVQIDVRIDEVMQDSKHHLRALASVRLDRLWAVHGIKVLDGKGGLYVLMPQRKVPSPVGVQFVDVFHPLSAAARRKLTEAVLDEYRRTVKGEA